jgi:uncharacterized membrane protein YphA (DoxX/SURF4 family)
MSFSQAASANVVPILARIVLALACVPAGWNKLTQETEFTGDDARRLRELQVVDATRSSDPRPQPVGLLQEEAAPPRPGRALQADSVMPAEAETPPATDPPTPRAPEPPSAGRQNDAGGPVSADVVRARALHNVTLMVDRAGMSYPRLLGWVAALTELVGGGLVLVGLLTRIWALGLAIAMGVAFYLTSLEGFLATWIFGMAIPDYTRLVAQLALFALAFGLVWSGPGVLSLDRLVFRPSVDPESKSRGTEG